MILIFNTNSNCHLQLCWTLVELRHITLWFINVEMLEILKIDYIVPRFMCIFVIFFSRLFGELSFLINVLGKFANLAKFIFYDCWKTLFPTSLNCHGQNISLNNALLMVHQMCQKNSLSIFKLIIVRIAIIIILLNLAFRFFESFWNCNDELPSKS